MRAGRRLLWEDGVLPWIAWAEGVLPTKWWEHEQFLQGLAGWLAIAKRRVERPSRIFHPDATHDAEQVYPAVFELQDVREHEERVSRYVRIMDVFQAGATWRQGLRWDELLTGSRAFERGAAESAQEDEPADLSPDEDPATGRRTRRP